VSDEQRHNQENGADALSAMPLEVMLSVYLDDRESLNAEALGRIETLLASDAEARRMYADLQSVVRELRHFEPVSAPRSYHLDPDMVGAPEPVRMTSTTVWYARHAGAVRWATAAAAVIFVFVLGADVALNNIRSNSSDFGDNAMPANQSRLSDDDEAVEEEAEEQADDAGAGAAEMLPPAQDDGDDSGGDGGGDADDAAGDDEVADTFATDGAATPAEDIETEDTEAEAIPTPQVDQGESEPISSEDSARDSEDSADVESLMFDEQAHDAGGGDSDRRAWRIVEFSLVVILGLLITAMVILPRMSGSPWRR
jgi:hypothetical protein